MLSPYEILLDARVTLTNDPTWSELRYPSAIHMAHKMVERAGIHLGIRALEGYSGYQSETEALLAILQCSPDGETPQAEPKVVEVPF